VTAPPTTTAEASPAPAAIASLNPETPDTESNLDTSSMAMGTGSETEFSNSNGSNDGLILLDEAYTAVHKIYDLQHQKWKQFNPLTKNLKDLKVNEKLIFTAYYRYKKPSVRPMVTFVDIHSEILKDVLEGCVEGFDLVTESVPRV
jgi:hypothetical protein